jgi:hypothetical protein
VRQAAAFLHATVRFVMSPPGFACCAALALLAWLAAPGIDAHGLGATPIAHWDLTNPAAPWRRDPGRGLITYSGAPLPADLASGLSLDFQRWTGGQTLVDIVWRRSDEPRWRIVRFMHPLTRTWDYFDLASTPAWSGEVHDLRVMTYARVSGMTLEARGPLGELSRAWRSFATPEFLDENSINFMRGVQVRQIGWTVPLVVIWAVFLFLKLAEAWLRRRALDWRSLVVFSLALWIVLDLRFTWDLAANTRADVEHFPLGAADAVVRSEPPAFAVLAATVQAVVPAEATIDFVTDVVTSFNKAQYIFFPRVIGNWRPSHPQRPDYVVVFAARNVQFDPGRELLTLPGGRALRARLVAHPVDAAFIFAVLPDDAAPVKPAG